MNAVTLRLILSASLIVYVGLTIPVYIFASQLLADEMTKTDHVKIEAKISASDIERLKSLKSEMEKNATTVQRAEQVIAQSKEYQYQNQIIDDIYTYANRAGIEVTGYTFDDPTLTAAKKSPTDTAAIAIKGVRATNATIALRTPIAYTQFLTFLQLIESNLTKMQVTGVNISTDPENPNNVINPTVGLIIYTRSN